MPYTKGNPPERIKGLPEHAQEIWISAYNAAHKQYDGNEEKANATAWSAVKNKYEQVDGKWRAKADENDDDEFRSNMALTHNSTVADNEPGWESVDKTKLPRSAFADMGDPGKKSTWGFPHHWVSGGKVSEEGIYTSGTMYLHRGGLRAALQAAGGARSGQEAGSSIKSHLETHARAIGIGKRNKEDEEEQVFTTHIAMDEASDLEGREWEVTICRSGFTSNGWYLSDEALGEAANDKVFENVDVNLYELPMKGATHLPDNLFPLKQHLIKNKVGWIDNVKFVAGKLIGRLHFLDSAKWLGRNLLTAAKTGKKVYGLSYDAISRAIREDIDGRTVFNLKKLVKADSVDIVTRPAAGGVFERAVAARPIDITEDELMTKQELFNILSEVKPELLDGKKIDDFTDESLTELARSAMAQKVEPPKKKEEDPPKKEEDPKPWQQDLELMRCGMALQKALDVSTGGAYDFPDFVKERIRAKFDNKIFTQEDLNAAIAAEKNYLEEAKKKFQKDEEDIVAVRGIRVGMGSYEKACLAVDKTFGLSQETLKELHKERRLDGQLLFPDRSVMDCEDFDDIKPFTGLQEMYKYFTGDNEMTGRFIRKNLPPELRNRMDITSTTFTYVLGNTLGRRLIATYRLLDYNESVLIATKKSVRDFRTQEAVLVGYFPSIADVDPETADYVEIATVTDEEATYSLGQKGNILTITRKTIINDDITLVQKLVDRFGRAFRRTHGEYVWNFWINNSNCSDGTAWHTGPHGNLGSQALTLSTALTAYIAIGKMTEKDSGKRLGLLDFPDVKPILIHPIDLVSIATTIATDDLYYTGADDRTTRRKNPLAGKITPLQLSHLTDQNDWGILIPAPIVDHLEMGYLNGRTDPEFFVADSPQSEQVFVADKIRYKGRHEYAGTPVDFRGSYKAEVT